jgi:hypothetical protein
MRFRLAAVHSAMVPALTPLIDAQGCDRNSNHGSCGGYRESKNTIHIRSFWREFSGNSST